MIPVVLLFLQLALPAMGKPTTGAVAKFHNQFMAQPNNQFRTTGGNMFLAQ